MVVEVTRARTCYQAVKAVEVDGLQHYVNVLAPGACLAGNGSLELQAMRYLEEPSTVLSLAVRRQIYCVSVDSSIWRWTSCLVI